MFVTEDTKPNLIFLFVKYWFKLLIKIQSTIYCPFTKHFLNICQVYCIEPQSIGNGEFETGPWYLVTLFSDGGTKKYSD